MNRPHFEKILGFPVTTLDLNAAVALIHQWVQSGGKGRYLVCANPHSLEIARTDRLFSTAIQQADMVTPDGVGMLVASKVQGGRIRQRITGSDIFYELSRILNQEGGCRYFFLGSTETNLVCLRDKIQNDFPNIRIAGMYSPPFKTEFTFEESRIMLEAVNRVKPDVLWVGMTAPKQEKWIYRHRDKLNVHFIGAIGAVFDFYTGTVNRSHPWFLEHGLEWLPRLIQEPRRLWDRTVVSAPLFLARIFIQQMSGKH